MNVAATVAIAFAMSTDAFAAALAKGAQLHRPSVGEAVRTGLIFGVIEALTPLIGWALGVAAARYVTAWDHWIAFVLLGVLGARMIVAGFRRPPEARPEDRPSGHPFGALVVTAIATSIDAMAIGVTLAFLDADIVITAAAIGMATFVMVSLGVMLGRVLGTLSGRRAEMVGGVVLIVIGTTILVEHLRAPAGG